MLKSRIHRYTPERVVEVNNVITVDAVDCAYENGLLCAYVLIEDGHITGTITEYEED